MVELDLLDHSSAPSVKFGRSPALQRRGYAA